MRIQMEVTPSQLKDIKDLMEQIGAETYKELFNDALTLLQWAVNQVKSGNVITSMDEEREKYKVLAMHALDRAANSARSSQRTTTTA